MRMGHPARLSSAQYREQLPIFLTACTYQRRRYFADSAIVSLVRSHFLQTAAAHDFAVLIYVFMPDHMHALVDGVSPAADFRRFVVLAKQHAAFHFTHARRMPLWQPSFFDRTLREHESPRELIRYILMNPVRHGLVSSPADYEFWGSSVYTRTELLEYVQMT